MMMESEIFPSFAGCRYAQKNNSRRFSPNVHFTRIASTTGVSALYQPTCDRRPGLAPQ